MKKRSLKKILSIIAICVVVLLIAGWWAFCVVMYNANFNVRCESYEPKLFYVEDFEGLSCKDYTFTSDKGQKLAGYLYSAGDEQRGIVVLAHGFGGGHNSYMDCAYFFAKNGYYKTLRAGKPTVLTVRMIARPLLICRCMVDIYLQT